MRIVSWEDAKVTRGPAFVRLGWGQSVNDAIL